MLRESIALAEQVLAEHPDLPANRIEFSKACSHLATLLVNGGQPDDGLARTAEPLRCSEEWPMAQTLPK